MSKAHTAVRSAENQSLPDGERYGHVTYRIGIVSDGDDAECGYAYIGEDEDGFEGSMKLSAHVIYDPRSEVKANDTLLSEVLSLQQELTGMRVEQAKKLLAKRRSQVVKALSLEADDHGNTVTTVNYNSITFSSNRAGMFVLLTPEGMSWDSA